MTHTTVMNCLTCGNPFSAMAHENDCLPCQIQAANRVYPIWQSDGTEYNAYVDTSKMQFGELSSEGPIKSDGGSTAYYKIPPHATELYHLISHKGMSFARGNVMKACYRLGEKQGTDVLYDINKMRLFINELEEMHKRGEPL